MSPQHKDHNRADQGLNTKVYMAAIVAAIIVIIVSIFIFVSSRGTKDIPKANRPNPNSALLLPHTEATT